jgi:hypothetical protein
MRATPFSTRFISWVIGPIALVGCTVPNIHKTDEFSADAGVQTLSIDAKQRVVIVAKIPNPNSVNVASSTTTSTATSAGTSPSSGRPKEDLIPVTCAEPSPDALSALSTSVGGSVQDPKVLANFAVAASESAASIGLRTQSIQLLRDGMYRSCEAYAARAIDGPEFNRQQRRYQNLMLSLLAIEQLTGAVAARQVGLGDGAAGASAGENADQAAADVTAATNAVNDAQKALTAAQTTQANDQKVCKAAAPDTTAPTCAKATDDQTAVDEKASSLETARKKAETAKMALQAARGSVTASAAGAHVSFSDAPKTNPITDASARYVAEATRTIVSTTLLASFAQEECARIWDILDLYQRRAASTSSTTVAPKTLTQLFGIDVGAAPTPAGTPISTQEQMLQRLFSNCSDSQQALLSKAALFTPDYGVLMPPALTVLGADVSIPLPVGGAAVDLRILGGTPPYEAIVTPALKPELEATIPSAKGAVHTVHIERPMGASKLGSAAVTIVDANNAHVDIPITLAAAKLPVEASAAAATPPTDVIAKDGGGGKITVTFKPPSGGKIKKFTATATNTDTTKRNVLAKDGPSNATSIDISGCTAGETYDVTVETIPTTGKPSAPAQAAPPPVPCSVAPGASPPAKPPAAPPAPPTAVTIKPLPGGKLEVSFAASKDDGDGPITKYTATATDTTNKEIELKGTATTPMPITVSGCKTGDNYTASVFATRGATDGAPGNARTGVPCAK